MSGVFILILITTIVANIVPSDSCGTINLPQTFYLRGQWESYWHKEVYITPGPDTDDDDGKEFGIFTSLCMSLNGDVELTDASDDVVGWTDVQSVFEWGKTFNIYDCTGQLIWIIDEEDEDVIINGLNPFSSVYSVYEADSNGAKSDMIGFADDGDVSLDSEYSIRDMQGNIRVSASKSFGDDFAANFGSDTTWTVITTGNETSYPYNVILTYLVALEEVQDRLGDKTYDMCTSWAIGGIVIACLIALAIIVCGVYCLHEIVIDQIKKLFCCKSSV